MLLTDKYADKMNGMITCYDRMIIQGYIPGWSFTGYNTVTTLVSGAVENQFF